mgnify:FL=1
MVMSSWLENWTGRSGGAVVSGGSNGDLGGGQVDGVEVVGIPGDGGITAGRRRRLKFLWRLKFVKNAFCCR